MAAGFVRPAAAGQRLGNTCLEASRGRELPKPTSRTVVKHPLPISPSRRWFALEVLWQLGPVSSSKGGRGRSGPRGPPWPEPEIVQQIWCHTLNDEPSSLDQHLVVVLRLE